MQVLPVKRSSWISVDPESNDWRPYKDTHRDTDTEGKKPHDKRGRGQSDAATSQGRPWTARSWKTQEGFPLEPWREHGPAYTSTADV